MSIHNYGAALPKKFQSKSHGANPNLNINNLFRMIILSPSNGGKTNLAMHILKESPNIYTHLHLIARNPDQPIYDFLKDKLEGHITVYDPDTPPSVDQIKANGSLQLVIIDDYSNDKKLQKELFSHYFTRGRHKLLSTIFLSHSYFATDKMIRLNAEYMMILKANSKRDMRMIMSDFTIPGLTIEKLMRAYQIATKDKGQGLLIDSVNAEMRYNFQKKIDISEL